MWRRTQAPRSRSRRGMVSNVARTVFFSDTRSSLRAIAELYNFVWPTAAALWNLRWQVRGFLAIRPDAAPDELNGRFVVGSGLPGVDFRDACERQTWDNQQQQLAKFVLFELCSYFEGWLEQVLEKLGKNTKKNRQGLQFPSGVDKQGKPAGYLPTMNKVTSPESVVLKNSFYATLLKHRKNGLSQIESLLVCYRYFKECRNCLMHGGGTASQGAEDAFAELAALTNKDLGVRSMPEHHPLSSGAAVELSLRGVVGFGDIVARLIVTMDAELSRCEAAERELRSRWHAAHGSHTAFKGSDRQAHIRRLVKKLRLPPPLLPDEIGDFLVQHRLASW